jgi:hypothetical protein
MALTLPMDSSAFYVVFPLDIWSETKSIYRENREGRRCFFLLNGVLVALELKLITCRAIVQRALSENEILEV